MNEKERVSYAILAFQVDFAKIGRLDVWPLDVWRRSVLAKDDIDPEGHHKHLGVLLPALTEESNWVISLCPELICRHVQEMNDDNLTKWLLFLIAHLQMHLIVVDWALQIEPIEEIDLKPEDSEKRVNEEMEALHPDLFHFGETVRYRVNKRKAGN